MLSIFAVAAIGADSDDCGCDYTVTPDKSYLNGDHASIEPGDVICLQAGTYDYIHITNVQGSLEKRLLITNCGGPVTIQRDSWGFVITNSRHFRLTGTGDPAHKEGISISTGGTWPSLLCRHHFCLGK